MSESLTVEGWRLRRTRGRFHRCGRVDLRAVREETAVRAVVLSSGGRSCSRTWQASCSRSSREPPRPAPRGLRGRVTPGFEYLAFLLAIPCLAPPAAARGALRPRRGAHRPLDGRRHRRCLSECHDRRLDLRSLRRCHATSCSRCSPGSASSGSLAIVLIPTLRAVARTLCRHLPGYTQNAVIVGAGHVGQQLALKLTNHREYGINLVGFVDDRPTELDDELARTAPAPARRPRPTA